MCSAGNRGMLKLCFFNVGDGDAALIEIQDQGGKIFRLLVDAGKQYLDGPCPGSARSTAAEHLRRMGVERLDAVIVTHLHQDHFGGLAQIAGKIPVDTLYAGFIPGEHFRPPTANPADPKTVRGLCTCLCQWDQIVRELRARGTSLCQIANTTALSDVPEVQARLLCPDPAAAARQNEIWRAIGSEQPVSEEAVYWSSKWRNPGSLRLELEYAGRRIILAGDCYGQQWENPVQPPCDILKVPHHGDAKALTQGLVNDLKPAYAVISCQAEYNPLKDRPSQNAISMLLQVGSQVWFTDSFCVSGRHTNHWPSVDFTIGDDGTIYPPKT